jgi:hypothetical protein
MFSTVALQICVHTNSVDITHQNLLSLVLLKIAILTGGLFSSKKCGLDLHFLDD